MLRLKSAAALAVIATVAFVGAGAAIAQTDAIKQRQDKMKAIGGAMGKVLVKMVKGEEPYDAAKAKAAVETIGTNIKGFTALFPKGTETGGDTEATAKIWSDPKGFEAAAAKLEQVAAAQVEPAGKGAEGLKAVVGALGGACKGCHDEYRVQKK